MLIVSSAMRPNDRNLGYALRLAGVSGHVSGCVCGAVGFVVDMAADLNFDEWIIAEG